MKYRLLTILLFAVNLGFGQIYIDSYRFASAAPTDQFFSNVSLLMHFNGSNNSTTFIDDSPNEFLITSYGDSKISTTESKFGGAAGYFDGNEDYLSYVLDNNFLFGTGDFTIESWVNFIDASGERPIIIYGQGTSGSGTLFDTNWSLIKRADNTLTFLRYVNGVFESIAFPWTPSNNTWYHVALTRSSGQMRAFVDGTQIGTTQSYTTNITSGTNNINPPFIARWRIGSSGLTNTYFYGYLDDLRVTKGVARYTSNFTPPAAQFPDN